MGLLYEMLQLRMPPKILTSFSTWFLNRKPRIKRNFVVYGPVVYKYGLTQGSVQSLLLLVIYIYNHWKDLMMPASSMPMLATWLSRIATVKIRLCHSNTKQSITRLKSGVAKTTNCRTLTKGYISFVCLEKSEHL